MFNEVSYRAHSTGFGELGNAPNYVFGGARIYWAGNVSSYPAGALVPSLTPPFVTTSNGWASALARFRADLSSEFHSVQVEANENAKSLGVNVTAPGDFADLNDVKALINGIAGSAGFGLAASMIRFISNPRTDQGTTPNVGGGNLATGAGGSKDPFTTAGEFWGSEITGTASSFWKGLTGQEEGGGMSVLVIAALAIGAVLILKK